MTSTFTSKSISNISRDWHDGMIEFAVIGYDYDAPNPLAPWVVRTGRTVSGKAMERTDEAIEYLTIAHFETSTEAARWMTENDYR